MFFPGSIEAVEQHLENTQWWPADILRRYQVELLRPLLAHAYRTVPWYRQCDAIRQAAERGIDDDTWQAIPLLTRTDIQEAGPRLHARSVPGNHGAIGQTWTGGSTASPVMVLATELTRRFWIANTMREHRWQHRDLSSRMAVIRYLPNGGAEPPEGVELDHWGTATAGRMATGRCAVLNVSSTTSQQAQWLERVRPSYLQTYPSVALALADYSRLSDISVPGLRQVCTFGEVVDLKVREACRLAWDAEVVDSYSTNEVGHVAIECSEHRYHVQAEHLVVEVLDGRGRPCQAGQIGCVVITDLFNYAMPLVRYDIGDYAEVGEPCPCGRNLPILARILGRQRNMFLRPDGEKYWPAMLVHPEAAFEAQLPVRQFQMIQTSLRGFELKLVVTRALTTGEESIIRGMVGGIVGRDCSIRTSYVDHIARSDTGKFEDFRCDLSLDQ